MLTCALVTTLQGYGLAETNSITTSNTGLGYLSHRTSCGRPVLNVEVCITRPGVGVATEVLPRGSGPESIGEICIRGPTLMAGKRTHPHMGTHPQHAHGG